MKKYLFLIFLLLVACQDQSLFSEFGEGGLTVEAYIKPNESPIVYLTRGLPIDGFEEIDILKSIESTAKVEMSNGEFSEIAVFSKDNNKLPSRFYAFENMVGEVGGEYSLTITVGNESYHADTYVPIAPVLDSISVINSSSLIDGAYSIRLELRNSAEDTYYKFYLKNNIETEFVKASTFVISNESVVGERIVVFLDYLDFDEDGNEFSLLKVDNLYDIRIVSISRDEYLFWEQILGSQTSNVNLPSLTKEVPSNITNNAFGFFSGNSEIISSVLIQE